MLFFLDKKYFCYNVFGFVKSVFGDFSGHGGGLLVNLNKKKNDQSIYKYLFFCHHKGFRNVRINLLHSFIFSCCHPYHMLELCCTSYFLNIHLQQIIQNWFLCCTLLFSMQYKHFTQHNIIYFFKSVFYVLIKLHSQCKLFHEM